MRRHSLVLYFVLASAISWLVWLPLVLESFGVPAPALPYHHFYGAAGPILAAFVAARAGGRERFAEFTQRLLRWRVSPGWYAVALASPAAIFLVSALFLRVAGEASVDFGRFGASEEFPGSGIVMVWIIHTMTFGLGEEAGWRGFALPVLQRRRSALSATLILSVFWALWHIPMFFYRPGYGAMGPGDIVGWFFSLVCGAILLTWLFNGSRGSVVIVALFHGAVDVAFTSKGVGPEIMNVMGTIMVLWAIAVLAIHKPATLSPAGRKEGAESP